MSAPRVFPGSLAVLSDTFTGGIWLRETPNATDAREELRVRGGLFLVVEVLEDERWEDDPSLRVVTSEGLVGWTFLSRLRLVEDVPDFAPPPGVKRRATVVF